MRKNFSSYIKLFNAVMSAVMSMQFKKLDGHSYSCYDWGQFYNNAKLMKKKKKLLNFHSVLSLCDCVPINTVHGSCWMAASSSA